MKKAMLSFLCAVSLLLTSCSAVSQKKAETYPTLPPYAPEYSAPVGDAGMIYMSPVTLYLPSKNGSRLLAVTENVVLNYTESKAKPVCQALLDYKGSDNVRALGGSVVLSLYGDNPVTCSGGVCTVNLSPSAAQLDSSDFYKVCLSIGATLCELPEIQYVNVLVASQSVPLDITGTLPMGSITGHPGEDISVLWEQMDSRKVPLGSNPALTPLTSAVSLYFPVAGICGIMPETRNVTFTGQSPSQLVLGLLNEMSSGAVYISQATKIPNIISLMTLNPEISSLEDGSKMVSLYFGSDIEEILKDEEIDPSSFYAAIEMTIFSFVPAVSSVRIFSGKNPVSVLMSEKGDMAEDDGRMRLEDASAFLDEQLTFCLPGNSILVPSRRYVSSEDGKNIRLIIRRIFENPSSDEEIAGIRRVFPGKFTNSDLVGISVIDGTLLINLSMRTADSIATMSPEDERLLLFGIVNTLSTISGFSRFCFFFEGKSVETLAGGICWNGEFQPAGGLNRQNGG